MAIGPFDTVLRDVIHGLKFQGRRSLASALGALLRETGAALLSGADAVVPVPLHPWRQWQRGYNQADLLAATLGLPVWRVLKRTRATRSQSRLDALSRRHNVHRAFAPGGWWPGSRGAAARRVSGRVVVLVDDVLTTGATLEACARALQAAGASEVRALTAARAELRS
jgi:ComF family protein